MSYAPPPPPGYPPAYYPRYSGCLKFFLYGLSLCIPIAGIVIAIIFMSKGDPEATSIGKICLIISIVIIVIGCCVGGIVGILPVIMEAVSSY